MEARKAFQFAHSLDPSNIQIVIDLADLQVQTRDYEGFYKSRNKLLQERSGNTTFWLGFVVGAFLSKSYDVCIDIINTLSRHYGVTVPLFVDNAESVTCLEPSLAQVVRLVVSESDKEVRMV